MPPSTSVRCNFSFLVFASLVALSACVPPKAVVADQSLLGPDAQPTTEGQLAAAVVTTDVPVDPVEALDPAISEEPADQGDGDLKLPDMLALPGEGDFRATNPSSPRRNLPVGPVIARPPTDPPPRPKPPSEKPAE